jgi:ABC-2 type transport system ATP-binding protein
MSSVIEINNLTKMYGNSRGVEDLTLSVPSGTIFGFLGPNGAGKTTTISMLVSLTKPSSGTIRIFGTDIATEGLAVRKDIGYLSSDMGLDGHLTGWQQLKFFQHLRGLSDQSYIKELADRLDCNLNRKIRTLSRGNRQKVALISALMHKPQLLILDEPTSGLDPLIQAEFNNIILEHKQAGRSTFISSHVLSEIQELCDHVAFIRSGKLITTLTMEELMKASPKQVRIVSGDKKLAAAIKKLKGVENFSGRNSVYTFSFAGDSSKLISLLSNHVFSDIVIENTDLEHAFMTYYEDKSGGVNA